MPRPVETRGFYAAISAAYANETFTDDATVRSIGRRARTAAACAMLDRHLARSSVVADVGCGPGQLAGPIVARGHRYIGLDLAPEMLRGPAAGSGLHGVAMFLGGRVEAIPLAAASVDAVVCAGVLEYVGDPDRALGELRRILRPRGIAVVSFPNALNPVHALRAALRPVLAPVLRVVTPSLRETVFVSGVAHRIFPPGRFRGRAEALGFTLVEECRHGYVPAPFNHRLSRRGLAGYARLERAGHRLAPALGSNVIQCLRRTG